MAGRTDLSHRRAIDCIFDKSHPILLFNEQ
jgi:hypothetical protein